jgi:hypothetical protein
MDLGDVWPQQSRDRGPWRLTRDTQEGDQPLDSVRQAVGSPATAPSELKAEPVE